MAIPKTLVFHDSKQDATDSDASGIIKHYHSDMSAKYLQKTFNDFSLPDGTCWILHATAGAATVSHYLKLLTANV
ncbi:hypothetical protein JVU11DRAFT_6242 [Chiua virens]|nr:hypothetical protein JVU11DRAFT_6242 [Chiua virens]